MVAEAAAVGTAEGPDMPPLVYSHTGPQSAGKGNLGSGAGRSPIHASNEGTFRPKGQWKKKSNGKSRGGTSTSGNQSSRASHPQLQDENRSSAFPSTSRSTGADIFTMPDRGPPEEVPVLTCADGGWGFSPASNVSPSGRDLNSRRSQPGTQGALDMPSSGTGRARRSHVPMPPKPGTLLQPLDSSCQHPRAPRDAPGDWMEPSPPMAGGSTLAPIHFVPATQFLEPLPDQVDLLTLSPSKAQEHLKRERKRRDSVRSERRSTLSKGVSMTDTAQSSDFHDKGLGNTMRSNFSNEGGSSLQRGSSDLHRQALMGSSHFESNDVLSVKMSRMNDQANAIEAKLQARSDDIIRQIDYAMPGMRL